MLVDRTLKSQSFIYLGNVVHDSGLSDQDVSRLIGMEAGGTNSAEKSIWRCSICTEWPSHVSSKPWWCQFCTRMQFYALESFLMPFVTAPCCQIMDYSWQDHETAQNIVIGQFRINKSGLKAPSLFPCGWSCPQEGDPWDNLGSYGWCKLTRSVVRIQR